jgi:hypothetical protein
VSQIGPSDDVPQMIQSAISPENTGVP